MYPTETPTHIQHVDTDVIRIQSRRRTIFHLKLTGHTESKQSVKQTEQKEHLSLAVPEAEHTSD